MIGQVFILGSVIDRVSSNHNLIVELWNDIQSADNCTFSGIYFNEIAPVRGYLLRLNPLCCLMDDPSSSCTLPIYGRKMNGGRTELSRERFLADVWKKESP